MVKNKDSILDFKDSQIINALYTNSRLSCREISKRTNIPVMTVLNRMKRLEKEKIILEYSIRTDLHKLGFNTLAYVIVTIDYNLLNKLKITQQTICDEIIKHPNIGTVDLITGPDRDVLVKVRARSIDELNKVLDDIRLITGVNRTDTMNILYESRKACLINHKFKQQKILAIG